MIDAFRVESLEPSEQAAGMASYVATYRIGMVVSGAGALYIVEGFERLGFGLQTAWTFGYLAMAMFVLIGIATAIFATEPRNASAGVHAGGSALKRVFVVAVAAFRDFLSRDLAVVILIFVVFYFLMIRPQQKRMKSLQDSVAAVKKGDTVVTAGGLIGKVTKVDETEVEIELGTNVKVRAIKATLAEVRGLGAKPAND